MSDVFDVASMAPLLRSVVAAGPTETAVLVAILGTLYMLYVALTKWVVQLMCERRVRTCACVCTCREEKARGGLPLISQGGAPATGLGHCAACSEAQPVCSLQVGAAIAQRFAAVTHRQTPSATEFIGAQAPRSCVKQRMG
jgi:hypothetical protein